MLKTNNLREQQIIHRSLSDEEDFWRVHRLLIDTYPTTPLGFNWNIRRWEGKRFYEENPVWPSPHFSDRVQLWETIDGYLVGAVFSESDGDAYLQARLPFRAIEAEMITWAEDHLMTEQTDDHRQLEFFVYDYDTYRQELLARRGYAKTEQGGMSRRLYLNRHSLPEPMIATGYKLRTTNPANLADCQRIADLLNAAFNRNFHNALEYQNFAQFAPSFQQALDLVAVAPDGSFAAYVGIPYDKTNQLGIFEPVCTHPDHRRRGLAQALMREGLRRLHAVGALDVIVETGDMIPANRLYDNIGFTEICRGAIWRYIFES